MDVARLAKLLAGRLAITSGARSRPALGYWFGSSPGHILTGYFLSAVVVFDFTHTAWSGSEEYDETGRKVAFGPAPRWPFNYGASLDIPGGWDYNGSEPVFKIYRPICDLWRQHHGYAIPSVWR